jgi:hypothetical protein
MAADPHPYATFRILDDEHASRPLLGFDEYADAFAELIQHSRPQFAIGIFGSWGSGKTTLMRAIEGKLTGKPDIIPVWFNAWRYEREEHLVVPMLDTLREELERRARSTKADATTKERALDAARAMGRAGRAIARGLKLRAGIPFTGIGIDADFNAIEEALKGPPPAGPVSFYHAAFSEMESAIKRFGAQGARRIVVFIDDLDRCLPSSALTVLESMKLFFDFQGFIFVVGLDQDVIQRAIEVKYGVPSDRVVVVAPDRGRLGENGEVPGALAGSSAALGGGQEGPLAGTDGAAEREAKKLGSEYVKKIFQVPFTLPRIPSTEVGPFFTALINRAKLPHEQLTDLRAHVRPHLRFLSADAPVNPREVKRLINAYTLQMKLLHPRVPDLSADAVMALLVMSFSTEWRYLYDLLVADPEAFVKEVSAVRDSPSDGPMKLWPSDKPVNPDFLQYVGGRPGDAILQVDDLRPYVASVEATRTATLALGPAQALVVGLGRRVAAVAETGDLTTETQQFLSDSVGRLFSALVELPSLPTVTRIHDGVSRLEQKVQNTPKPPDGSVEAARTWARETDPILRALFANLRQVRLLTDVGGQA